MSWGFDILVPGGGELLAVKGAAAVTLGALTLAGGNMAIRIYSPDPVVSNPDFTDTCAPFTDTLVSEAA